MRKENAIINDSLIKLIEDKIKKYVGDNSKITIKDLTVLKEYPTFLIEVHAPNNTKLTKQDILTLRNLLRNEIAHILKDTKNKTAFIETSIPAEGMTTSSFTMRISIR